jgi:hypothetical protein
MRKLKKQLALAAVTLASFVGCGTDSFVGSGSEGLSPVTFRLPEHWAEIIDKPVNALYAPDSKITLLRSDSSRELLLGFENEISGNLSIYLKSAGINSSVDLYAVRLEIVGDVEMETGRAYIGRADVFLGGMREFSFNLDSAVGEIGGRVNYIGIRNTGDAVEIDGLRVLPEGL